ncbi:MAG: hypothetical protein R3Y57_01710 [Erysipelotrichaceae bacterium]
MSKKIWILASVIVLIISVYGYLDLYPNAYNDALYFAFHLFTFNYSIEDYSQILMVTRWIAPLLSLSGLILVVELVFMKIKNHVMSIGAKTMVITGSGHGMELFCKDLKQNHIPYIASDNAYKSDCYVIMYESDEESLTHFLKMADYYRSLHHPNLKVYIQLESFDELLFNQYPFDVYPFSNADALAQLFWQSEMKKICKACYEKEDAYHICIIGDGIYAQKLLKKGLLTNIFSIHQKIVYHVFNDWTKFQYSYLSWKDICCATNEYMLDEVIFHHDDWMKDRTLLDKMDLIVISHDQQYENLKQASKLKFLKDVQCSVKSLIFDSALGDLSCFESFGNDELTYNHKVILKESLIQSGKAQHENYVRLHGGVSWSSLSYFLKQSNIESANFNKFNMSEISQYIKENKDETMNELEHIRWSRFHYMHNWQYGERNNDLRRHNNLVPYKELNKVDQLKDQEVRNSK